MADSDDDQLHEVSDAEIESMISNDNDDDDNTEPTSLGSDENDDNLSFDDDYMAPNYPERPALGDEDESDSDDDMVYERSDDESTSSDSDLN